MNRNRAVKIFLGGPHLDRHAGHLDHFGSPGRDDVAANDFAGFSFKGFKTARLSVENGNGPSGKT